MYMGSYVYVISKGVFRWQGARGPCPQWRNGHK